MINAMVKDGPKKRMVALRGKKRSLLYEIPNVDVLFDVCFFG